MKKVIIVIVIAVVVVAYFLLRPGERQLPTRPPVEVEHYKEVTLYYGSPDATDLVAESRRVEISDQISDNIRTLIEELISGPRGDGIATLPSSTRLRAVFVRQGIAYLDFSRELVKDFSGGTAAEQILVGSLVQTVTSNFPEIEGIRILIEGEEATTIGGHLYISNILRPKDWR